MAPRLSGWFILFLTTPTASRPSLKRDAAGGIKYTNTWQAGLGDREEAQRGAQVPLREVGAGFAGAKSVELAQGEEDGPAARVGGQGEAPGGTFPFPPTSSWMKRTLGLVES